MDNMKDIIDKIVPIEWKMFVSVNGGEDPASCQEDPVTFDGMRRAQFTAWSPETAASYLGDLEAASLAGRNLVEEKYIHMMKTTEPMQYEQLLSRVTLPNEAADALAHEVSDLLLEQTRVLYETYPYVSGSGRPLYALFDNAGTSVETYQLSELLTYSEQTLKALKEHILHLEKDGVSLARVIQENTVKFYGYSTLEQAEAVTKERIDKLGIQVTYGACAGGGECEI